MEIVVLDVKGTHVSNPDCKMRLMYHTANNHWYCIDCGLTILHTRVAVMDEGSFITLQEWVNKHDYVTLGGPTAPPAAVEKPCPCRNPHCESYHPEREKAASGTPAELTSLLADITRAVRTADLAFENVGGSSRHWVRDCLLPALEEEGLSVVKATPVAGTTTCGCTGPHHCGITFEVHGCDDHITKG